VEGVPPPPRTWPGEESDAVLPPLYPTEQGLRGGATESEQDLDAGPRTRCGRIGSGSLRTGSSWDPGRVDVRRIVHATAEEGAMEVDVETVSDESERSPPRYSDSEREGVDKKPGPRQSRPRKRARGRPRKDGTGPFKPASPTNEELVRDAFGGHVPTLRPVDVVPLIGRM